VPAQRIAHFVGLEGGDFLLEVDVPRERAVDEDIVCQASSDAPIGRARDRARFQQAFLG